MDFESPDVEKDFPGLYASESGRKSNESDFSEGGDHDKPSKKDLLGRRKDKKEKKDRGYAALEGESSPEEDTDTKSPSKSKKTKSFKFPTKSKEKREKSRDKEKVLEDAVKHKELNEKEKKKEKEKEKEKKEKEKKLKEKDKEKEEKAKFKLESKEKLKDEKKEKSKDKEKVKDKDKEKVKEKDKEKVKEKDKDKVKDKDKKDKKLAKVPSTVTSGIPFEEIFTLGVALPIFGVSLQQSVERSRCHDDTCLPLVVRDSIDYLQEHGLKSPHIYRGDVDKVKLQQLRRLYTDRGAIFPYHWDVPVATAILKNFLSELPDSILTQELHTQFEQSTAMAEPQREAHIHKLVSQLPNYNHSLLGWLVRHFECVVAHEQYNHMNLQSLASAMCPALNMSQSLFTYLVKKADKFFPDVELTKYIPPLVSLPNEFPHDPEELYKELRKQESLLAVVHAEMHAGFTSPARDHQLWEAQRIVTQIKRKLRSLQKSVEPQSLPPQPSVEEKPDDEPQLTQPVAEIATETVTKNLETEKVTLETVPVNEVAKSVADAFSPVAEPFKPVAEPFKVVTEPFKPVAEPFKVVTEPFKPVAEPFKVVTEPFKPVAEPFKVVAEPFKPVTEAFKPVTETIKPFLESPKPNEAVFPTEFDDNFDFQPTPEPKTSTQEIQVQSPPKEKPKLTEKELEKLRLELENAEYQQLKSLLQAKINSEKFEIVKLKSQIALKSKQNNSSNNKENKDAFAVEDEDLKLKLMKENAILEHKRNSIINQIFEERVACIQLKIELALKDLI